MTTFGSDPVVEVSELQERSGLATAALICSCIICCPITTIIGPILGLIALLGLRGKPEIKGKGVACWRDFNDSLGDCHTIYCCNGIRFQ